MSGSLGRSVGLRFADGQRFASLFSHQLAAALSIVLAPPSEPAMPLAVQPIAVASEDPCQLVDVANHLIGGGPL